MKRTPLKRHKRLRTYSTRGEIIKECLDLIRSRLFRERGNKCEICGRKANNIGLFHILRKGQYPRLRFNKFNILLACWHPCHSVWHHDYFNAPKIEQRIKELRGADYKEKLLVMDKTASRLTMVYLQTYLQALQNQEV